MDKEEEEKKRKKRHLPPLIHRRRLLPFQCFFLGSNSMKKQLLHGATPASSSPSSFSPFLCFLLLLLLFLGSDSMGSREPWEAVLLRFSEPWDPTAVCTGPCFFPIERFLRLKEPQKWTIQYFSGWTVRSCPGFKTLSLNSLFISPDSRLPHD